MENHIELAEFLGVNAEEKEVVAPSIDDNTVQTDQPVPEETPKETKEEPKAEPEEPKRDLEKDSAFAALRREKERLEKEQKERDKWYQEHYGDYGVTSEKEYRDRLEKQREEELVELATGGDTSAIDELATLKAQTIAQEALMSEKINLQLQSELFELNSKYGLSLKETTEIALLPNGEVIESLMSSKKPNGEYYTASEAYRMANMETILADEIKKAKQIARNEASGFNHTKAEVKAGDEVSSVSLDAETLALYEKMGIKPNLDFLKTMIK